VAIVSRPIALAILWNLLYRPELQHQAFFSAALIGVAVTLITELLISIPIVYYLGIRQSHQVVGPLRRIIRVAEAIGSGDFSQRVDLRLDDVLKDLTNSINRMAENLQKRYPKSHG
jgi:nitrate/nitrite-specific signal transduction histidine kinase